MVAWSSTGRYRSSQPFSPWPESGGLEGSLTRHQLLRRRPDPPLLLLSDGTYLEDHARARQPRRDQWGMMNETGNYPGQPWLWL